VKLVAHECFKNEFIHFFHVLESKLCAIIDVSAFSTFYIASYIGQKKKKI